MDLNPDVSDHPIPVTTESGDKDLGGELVNLFDEINESVKSVKDNLKSLNDKINRKEISTAKGISLLGIKNQMMFNYLSNIIFIIMRKCSGKSIAGDSAIDRLVEIRTVIERIQPIENKLKYQIDKLIKIAATGTVDKNDPTHFRANPDNLVDGVGAGDENSEDETIDDEDKNGEKKSKTGVYVPPKLVPVHYDGNNSESSKKEKILERARKRALNSSVLQELRDEYLDTPVEVGQSNSFRQKQSKFSRDKQEYEETYFTRLPISKKEKHKSRSMHNSSNLDGLTNFEDISVLEADTRYSPAAKRRKMKQGASKKKKGFKSSKRKFH